MTERISWHGVPIDNLVVEEAVGAISSLLDSTCRRQQVVTLTPAMFVAARKDEKFTTVLSGAALVIPESVALRVVSIFHGPVLTRVPGVELAKKTLEVCDRNEGRVALFGSTEKSRHDAIEILNNIFPGIKFFDVEGEYSFSDDDDSRRVRDGIDRIAPDFALMAGRQVEAEKWIYDWLIQNKEVNVGLVGNFGQSIDVFSGKVRDYSRARSMGMEWIARMRERPQEFRQRHLRIFWALFKLTLDNKLRGE